MKNLKEQKRPTGVDPTDFKLSDDAIIKLSEIFTETFVPEVERACTRYLYYAQKERPSVIEDGKTLVEISKKTQDLRRLLKKSETALERVHLYLSEEHNKHDTLFWIDDLIERLRILDNMCFVTPAREKAENPSKGRPGNTKNEAARGLAFHLREIYRRAHGKEPQRNYDPIGGAEKGPMPRAAAILMPILGLKSNMARYFREIEIMDKKSKTD